LKLDLLSNAFFIKLETINYNEWSADCLVLGVFLWGSHMIPYAGSYIFIVILFIDSILSKISLLFINKVNKPWIAPADWCSYNPNLKCMSITLKLSPSLPN